MVWRCAFGKHELQITTGKSKAEDLLVRPRAAASPFLQGNLCHILESRAVDDAVDQDPACISGFETLISTSQA